MVYNGEPSVRDMNTPVNAGSYTKILLTPTEMHLIDRKSGQRCLDEEKKHKHDFKVHINSIFIKFLLYQAIIILDRQR